MEVTALEPSGAGRWSPGQVIPVDEASRVGEARRAAVATAHALGFDEADTARVALVATELATNLVRHAVGGQLVVQSADGPAVDLLAVDRGPGIADVRRAMVDGYSSGGTSGTGLGTGLGAVRRQADAVDLYTRPTVFGAAPGGTAGTVAWARCARRGRTPPVARAAADDAAAVAAVVDVAGVCVPV
ncbi:MAG TPA: ATP-binding protein, partial [Gemmatirosa sp.]